MLRARLRVGEVAKAKAQLPAADAAPALGSSATAAPAVPAAAAGGPDLLPADAVPKPFLEEELSLRELRSRLLSYGLSTIGLKSELRARLEYVLEHQRAQYTQWDPVAKAWS